METKSKSSLASSPKLSHKATPSTSLVSERLTDAEIESLRQNKKEVAALMQKAFPKARLTERLTNAEIEALKQDLKDKTAYLKQVYPNLRQAA